MSKEVLSALKNYAKLKKEKESFENEISIYNKQKDDIKDDLSKDKIDDDIFDMIKGIDYDLYMDIVNQRLLPHGFSKSLVKNKR